jgi:hypothetical protein
MTQIGTQLTYITRAGEVKNVWHESLKRTGHTGGMSPHREIEVEIVLETERRRPQPS